MGLIFQEPNSDNVQQFKCNEHILSTRSFKGFDCLLCEKWIRVIYLINCVVTNMRVSHNQMVVNELIPSRQITFIIQYIPPPQVIKLNLIGISRYGLCQILGKVRWKINVLIIIRG
jgi:hypothetical protein